MQPVIPTVLMGSNRGLEQANKAIEGMTRTIMSSSETRYEERVSSGQPVVQEDDRWLWKRFKPGEGGLRGYYRQYQRWNFRSKWQYGVWLKKSMAVDSHVTGTCLVVRSVRRTMSISRHENPVFLSMRGTPPRLARGGSAAAPRGDVETPPPTVEAKDRNSKHVEAVLPTRIEEAVPQTSETTLSRTGRRTTPDKPTDQATSSSAIGSSGGEHADKLAEPTVEERIRCLKSEIKRSKRGPTTHIRSMSGTVEYTETMSSTVEYTEGCPGRKEDCKCRAAERADSASHVGGANGQGKCRAAAKAASVSRSPSHVGGADGADDA